MDLGRVKHGLKTRFFKNLYRNQTSEPFLSGDVFASLSDLVVDSHLFLDPKLFESRVSKAQIVFCPSGLVENFVEAFPQRTPLDILLVGNGDKNFTSELQLTQRVTRFAFIQNSFISNGLNIFTLPIGLENKRLGVNGLIKFHPDKREARTGSILVGPFSPTTQSRNQFTEEKFSEFPNFRFIKERVELSVYSEYLHSHDYVLCPEGNGFDTHRVWETLYAGSKPVLLSSTWSKSLVAQGFPLILTDSWDPLVIENAIQRSRHDEINPNNISQLWSPHWKNLFDDLIRS